MIDDIKRKPGIFVQDFIICNIIVRKCDTREGRHCGCIGEMSALGTYWIG